MTDPVRWQVLTHVQATIQGMTRAGGYTFEPRPSSVVIEAVDLLTIPETAMPFFQILPDDRRVSREFMPFGRLRAVLSILVTAVVMAESGRQDHKFRAAELAAADLERALRVDLTRGGVAIWTRVLEPDPAWPAVGAADRRVIVPQAIDVMIERRYGAP